jgi:hypothetical protein
MCGDIYSDRALGQEAGNDLPINLPTYFCTAHAYAQPYAIRPDLIDGWVVHVGTSMLAHLEDNVTAP